MENTFGKDFYTTLLTKPEKAIEDLDLVYVHAEEMPIQRLKDAKNFYYLINNVPIKTQSEIDRINSLTIPPSWRKVKITDFHNGHLQAIGRDIKNRRQYRYHEDWIRIRNQTKFYKLVAFGESLSKIRKQVDKDLKLEGWPKQKITALVVKLMEETHIRIGNQQYAKRNKTYGLSTMRKRHLDLYKERLRFEFIGKKGKKHKITLKNKKLVRLVSQCEEIPGWELFQYYDKNGTKNSVESGMVNDYIHNVSGLRFSSKDFRTWAASLIFFDTLYDMEKTSDPQIKKENLLNAYDTAAKELGNSRNVCRKYYVHPLIAEYYKNDSIHPYFKKVENDSETSEWYSSSELAMLSLLKSYQPTLVD